MRGIQNTAVGLETVMTTENPSRNLADVMAQGLANLSTAVRPNANDILMSDGVTTVEQAITSLITSVNFSGTTDVEGKIEISVPTGYVPVFGRLNTASDFSVMAIPYRYRGDSKFYVRVCDTAFSSGANVTASGVVYCIKA